jgi:hypothetical protein
MKKFVLGCLGVLVIVAIAGGTLGYFYIYRPARSYVSSFAQLKEVPRLNDQIRNKAAFAPPATGELTPEVLERYLRMQQSFRDRMGARVRELDAKYKSFEQARGDRQPSVSEVLGALKDFGGLLLEAKRAQVEALNQEGFSRAEYEWVRNTVYRAAGLPIDVNIEQAIRQVTGETSGEDLANRKVGNVPEANRTLVAPHLEKLRENVALAFFGL